MTFAIALAAVAAFLSAAAIVILAIVVAGIRQGVPQSLFGWS
jgi:hypothetical protein